MHMEMNCVCKGSVAVGWIGVHGNKMCMQWF